LNIKYPVKPIIAALSTKYWFSGMKHFAFRSLHIILAISFNLELQATPPPRTNSFFSQCAIALSATSNNIAKVVSWIE